MIRPGERKCARPHGDHSSSEEDVVRMDHDPGARIEVRDGELVLGPRES